MTTNGSGDGLNKGDERDKFEVGEEE